jgi:ribonucleoside-diphosphate reductase alpha chain
MPLERKSITHRFLIGGELKGYLIAGMYEDGTLGEVFISAKRLGTFERGLLSCLALLISMLLQRGTPIGEITEKLKGVRFEPMGTTGNKDIPWALSVCDYISRWLELKFIKDAGDQKEKAPLGGNKKEDLAGPDRT